jgi:hypothetical protein
MKAAFVSKPGESCHGCGMAVDLDVEALEFPGTGRGTDAALSTFWDLARPHGWRPIIASPTIDQSESWHFDHRGPLNAVDRLFLEHRHESSKYRRPYPLVATVGAVLAQTMPVTTSRLNERYIQCRLLVAGFWCGEPDGYIGNKTIAALAEAGIKGIRKGTQPSLIIQALNEAEIGCTAMAAA